MASGNLPSSLSKMTLVSTAQPVQDSVSTAAMNIQSDPASKQADLPSDVSTSGSSNNGDSSSDPFTPSTPLETHRERAERLGLTIDADMAQLLFPPSACVFVANLIATKSDDELLAAVQAGFSAFGHCWVKIKRDSQGMPYAFVQYEIPSTASKAMIEMCNQPILGRPCRTEHGKVERSLYLSRVTGGSINEVQAREILAGCGEIERVYACTPAELAMFKLPEGIFVKFCHFGTARQAAEKFKHNSQFSLCQPSLPTKMNPSSERASRLMALRTPSRSSLASSMSPASRNLRAGPASLFVGGINMETNAVHLHTIFGHHGAIRNIEIVYRPTLDGGNIVYAFVDFADRRAADEAAGAVHFLGNVRLRVERRQSTPVTLSRTFRNANSPDGFPVDFGRFGLAPQFQMPHYIAPPMYVNNGFSYPAPQFGVPPMPAPMPTFGPGPLAPGSGNTS